jgi:hypothetical protein
MWLEDHRKGHRTPSSGEDSYPLATHTAGEPETTAAIIKQRKKDKIMRVRALSHIWD